MSSAPLLFDLASRAPTTRTLALRIRAEGAAAALDQAQLRADAARYQEVSCRSALNRVTGMPFNWTLNPYRGCTHACHYCFARRYQTQFELDPDDEFSSVIFVKTNLVEVLKRELDHPSWVRDNVAFGTATDPYQPIEGHYKLTRGALEALLAGKTSVGLITKGPMVVRDRDLLAEMSRTLGSTVYMSVPTVDEHAWSSLEPGTAHPLQRLRAVRQLRDAGVNAGVLMAPLVPGVSTRPEQLEATVKAVADHGAAFVGANVMFLKQGTRDHFLGFIRREFPQMLEGFEKLYRGPYAPSGYTSAIRQMISTLQQRYDIRPRERQALREFGGDPEPDTTNAACEQAAFEW
jgi:DNA repair photolyase